MGLIRHNSIAEQKLLTENLLCSNFSYLVFITSKKIRSDSILTKIEQKKSDFPYLSC